MEYNEYQFQERLLKKLDNVNKNLENIDKDFKAYLKIISENNVKTTDEDLKEHFKKRYLTFDDRRKPKYDGRLSKNDGRLLFYCTICGTPYETDEYHTTLSDINYIYCPECGSICNEQRRKETFNDDTL